MCSDIRPPNKAYPHRRVIFRGSTDSRVALIVDNMSALVSFRHVSVVLAYPFAVVEQAMEKFGL